MLRINFRAYMMPRLPLWLLIWSSVSCKIYYFTHYDVYDGHRYHSQPSENIHTQCHSMSVWSLLHVHTCTPLLYTARGVKSHQDAGWCVACKTLACSLIHDGVKDWGGGVTAGKKGSRQVFVCRMRLCIRLCLHAGKSSFKSYSDWRSCAVN